jgi:Na+-transporting methylmalonyl-CoA/oxaloacetate decarboxylase gamma subunit
MAYGRRSVNEPALWLLSINAFGAVLALLTLLAGAVWLLTVVFSPPTPATVGVSLPESREAAPDAVGREDAALIAAIHATVRQVLPGGVVTRIEEER